MAIKELTALVPAPMLPVEVGDKVKWESVQEQLGIDFPTDYYEYASTYGSGSFVDTGRLRVIVYNPLSSQYLDSVKAHTDLLTSLRAGEGDKFIPYDVFPASGGLLPWGSDDNANEVYWLTKGRSSKWRIVIRSHDNAFEEFDEHLTSFLAKIFTRNISAKVWPEPFFSDPQNIRFEADQVQAGPRAIPRNVYELYVENGNRADFWVRQDDSQPGVSFHIRLIDGKQAGPLPGLSNEYGRRPVSGDLYLKGTLVEKDTDLSHAYQSVFVRL